MRRPLICGIDPGKKGAIALYDRETKNLHSVHDMPLLKNKAGKNEVDGFTLTQLIDKHYARIELAVIEEVGSMPSDGHMNSFTFGYSTGLVTGVLAGFNIPIIRVLPSVWKMMCGLTSDKKLSLDLATKLFPTHTKEFTRKKDDGRAEAAILAHFGERFISK